nr:hypothetical protein [Escherichia coli]
MCASAWTRCGRWTAKPPACCTSGCVAGSTRQNRQGFHRYLVAVWPSEASGSTMRAASGARGVAGAGRAGLDGNRVRGGYDITRPKAAG